MFKSLSRLLRGGNHFNSSYTNKVKIKDCTNTGMQPLNLLIASLFFSFATLPDGVVHHRSRNSRRTPLLLLFFFFIPPLARGSAPLWYVTFVLVGCLCLDTIGPTCSDLLESPQHGRPRVLRSVIHLASSKRLPCLHFPSSFPLLIRMQKAAFGRVRRWW